LDDLPKMKVVIGIRTVDKFINDTNIPFDENVSGINLPMDKPPNVNILGKLLNSLYYIKNKNIKT
jgi:hypothetical protein